MISEILAGLNILEKLGRFWNWLRGRKPIATDRKSEPVESLPARFIRLFETHGVHRNQMPRFFGHGLTLQDVQDDASLFAKLDEELLEAACVLFAVRREWLDGAESQVHPCHDFYKHPDEFRDYLVNLRTSSPDGNLRGILIAPSEGGWQASAILVLQETIGSVGEKPIYRYHLCNNWVFAYWKARAYLTACVAIAIKHRVYIHGIYLHDKEIKRLANGQTLLGWQGKGIWTLGDMNWHAEDMALEPDIFLKDIDPERDNFGIKSGLRLWLDLEQKGLMDMGYKSDARQRFQNELAKYSSVAFDGVANIPSPQE